MKKTIILLGTLMIFGCRKAEVKPKDPEPFLKKCFTINLIKDITWKPIYSGYIAPKLLSNGDYYEGGQLKGKWSDNKCDCVIVKNSTIASNNFYFKIAKLSTDTLQVITGRFGVTLFYK